MFTVITFFFLFQR